MDLKNFLKHIPNSILVILLFTIIVSSLDGIIISNIVSYVTTISKETSINQILFYVSASFILCAVVYTALVLKMMLKNKIIKILNIKVKEQYLFEQVSSEYHNTDSSAHVSKFFNDFKLLETKYFSLVIEYITMITTGIISGIYVLFLNFPVGIVFILFSFLPLLVPKLFGNIINRKSEFWQTKNSILVGKITDLFNGLRTIKTYGSEEEVFNEAINEVSETEEALKEMGNIQAIATGVTSIISISSFLIPLSIGVMLVIHGITTPKIIITIFLANDRVVGSFRNAMYYLNEMKTTNKLRSELTEQEILFGQKVFFNDVKNPDLMFNNVSFSFGDKKILKKQSLRVPFGSKVLITGPSGKGKSTILDIIQGYLKPDLGEVIISNGVERYNQLDTVAYVQQKVFLFNSTLRFNLTLGKKYSDEECLIALSKVGLTEELGNDILDEVYGEFGSELSGGQRQRVEIARAILFGKKILLIDEATANLDEQLSTTIRKLLYSMPCTIIEVAHHYRKEDLIDNNMKVYELTDCNLKEVSYAGN